MSCETQEEVDHDWTKLTEDAEELRCGWVKDKYGLSRQIIPTVLLGRMLGDKDPVKAKRLMEAMLKMSKIEIGGLQQAYEQA